MVKVRKTPLFSMAAMADSIMAAGMAGMAAMTGPLAV
jgi:hypothetical protein